MLLPLTPAPPALLIPGRILALSTLSLTARALLAEAYARLRRGRTVSLSNRNYARRIGYPPHRIQSALLELQHAGYLVRHYTRPPVSRRLLDFSFPDGLTPQKKANLRPHKTDAFKTSDNTLNMSAVNAYSG